VEKAKRVGTIPKVKISDIIIGERIRTDMADLDSMALSLQIEGQLQPLIVTVAPEGKYHLIEGERRIRAAKSLGITALDCDIFESLPELRRKEIELITCVQRQNLSFIEEARAVKMLTDRRRAEAQQGGLSQHGRRLRNKDVAVELNMTESRMSENLRIAAAVEDYPELEAECLKRHEFLRRIRNGEHQILRGGVLQTLYQENFLVMNPLDCMNTINDKIIDLAILHPKHLDTALLDEVVKRLTLGGQIIVFTEHIDIHAWEMALKESGLNVGAKPYIWHIKDKGDYLNYIWAGKNRTSPMRPIPNMLGGSTPPNALSHKAKPMQLLNYIIKCCTERGNFVVVPECEDIETVRCCIEVGRNIRAACSNKIMRDKLILSVIKDK